MKEEKIIKLLEEIRDILKENAQKYDNTIKLQKEMNKRQMRTILIVLIVFLLLALVVVPLWTSY